MDTKKVWDAWENIALRYIKSKGYFLLERNFKFSIFWEIDLVAKDWSEVVFIEVKYRRGDKQGLPEESITKAKKIKILKTIQYYCKVNNIHEEDIRFDIISINKKEWKLIHYKRQWLE